jgi:hypothetical protein
VAPFTPRNDRGKQFRLWIFIRVDFLVGRPVAAMIVNKSACEVIQPGRARPDLRHVLTGANFLVAAATEINE